MDFALNYKLCFIHVFNGTNPAINVRDLYCKTAVGYVYINLFNIFTY